MKNEVGEDKRLINQIGFWSALAVTVFVVLFLASTIILAIVYPLSGWDGVGGYARSFTTAGLLPIIFSLLLAPSFVVMMVSIHYWAPKNKRVLSHIGLAFAIIYAVMCSSSYFTQITTVRQNILTGNLGDGLQMFIFSRPNSAVFNTDMLGYLFLSTATLFVAPIIVGGKLQDWIRRIFIISGVATLAMLPLIIMPNSISNPLSLLGLGLWSILFPIGTALLAMVFRR